MTNYKNKVTFVLFIIFLFAISIFLLNPFSVITFASTSEKITFEATFNSSLTKNADGSFSGNYKLENYNLTINTVVGATKYEWFLIGSGASRTSKGTGQTINLRNCNESGNYVCEVTTTESGSDVIKQSQQVKVTINPIAVNFTKFEARTREYDGTTKIVIDAQIASEFTNKLTTDSVTFEVYGNTMSASAEQNKFVDVKKEDIIFKGSNGSNYVVGEIPDVNVSSNHVLVNIKKKPVTIVWESESGDESFDYNGLNQVSKIKAYYTAINGNKVFLHYTISGFNGKDYFYDADGFTYAGDYTFKASVTESETNYDIKAIELQKGYRMSKAYPEIAFNPSPFTYNGLEQDASSRVMVTSNDPKKEIVLKFKNNKFTNVGTGVGAGKQKIKVSADETKNFYRLQEREYEITINKAVGTIDISKVKKNFEYNGSRQIIDSGATINNNEQKLVYSNNSFTTVLEGNNREVRIYAEPTENYDYVSNSFTITMNKKTIDTSLWKWDYNNPFVYGKEREVKVYCDKVEIAEYYKNEIKVEYKNQKATEVGVYVAEVTISLIDENNYNKIEEFPNLIWKINKQKVPIPVLGEESTIYNGKMQTLSGLSSNLLYSVSGNEQTNAGSYTVSISLNKPKNFEWQNGDSNDLTITWIIQKAKVATPNINIDNFDGTAISLGIREEDKYELIYGDDKFILLGLKDNDNYAWESTAKPHLRIDRPVEFLKGPALPIFVITLTIITIVLILVYFAFHSTVIIKRHCRKIALIKARKLKKQQLVLVTGDNLPEHTTFSVEPQQEETHDKKDEQENADNKEEVIKEVINEEENIINEEKKSFEEKHKIDEEKEEKVIEEKVSVNSEDKQETIVETSDSKKEEIVKDKPISKKENVDKTRKPYVKSRKKENKKKVAQKKKEITAKKIATKKEIEKKKLSQKKAKEKEKKLAKTTKKPKKTIKKIN